MRYQKKLKPERKTEQYQLFVGPEYTYRVFVTDGGWLNMVERFFWDLTQSISLPPVCRRANRRILTNATV